MDNKLQLGDSVLVSKIQERWGCAQHYRPWVFGSVTAVGISCVRVAYKGRFFGVYQKWIMLDDAAWRVDKISE